MSGAVLAVVDAGPLYAVLDADDRNHRRSVEVLQRRDLSLVIPALVVAEVTYIAGRGSVLPWRLHFCEASRRYR